MRHRSCNNSKSDAVIASWISAGRRFNETQRFGALFGFRSWRILQLLCQIAAVIQPSIVVQHFGGKVEELIDG